MKNKNTALTKSLLISLAVILWLSSFFIFEPFSCTVDNTNSTNIFQKSTITQKEDLIGTWSPPGIDSQRLEIRTEELRFNYRNFDYTIDGNILHLTENDIASRDRRLDIPFELDGDILTIDLGDDGFLDASGYFYGRSGKVKLQKQ